MLNNKNMTLMEMLQFEPNDNDMLSLDLDVVLYMRLSIVSLYKELNHSFLEFFFKKDEMKDFIKDINKTMVYDFDASNTTGERFVTIAELYGLQSFISTSDYFKEVLEEYTHEADIIIDFFTHDNKKYRLSNLDGIVKVEEIK